MAETKPEASKVPQPVPVPGPPLAGTPANTDQILPMPPSGAVKSPGPGPDEGKVPGTGTPLVREMKPAGAQVKPAEKPVWNPKVLFMVAAILALLFVLVFVATRRQEKGGGQEQPVATEADQEGQELSNYSEYVAKSKALNGKPYSETVLTDEPYFGRVPIAVRENGPLFSPDVDPQLAALANALRRRVQISYGSQMIPRGRIVSRISKGDFRGFKVNAVEKLDNGKVISEEITITTPQGGMFQTVDQILQDAKKTDQPRILGEIQKAGLEFSAYPESAEKKTLVGRLRSVRPWGKPVAGELLIAEKSVGPITLGMPVGLIRNRLGAAGDVLKRKVLVNDIYYDVYKVSGRANEPLFYIYGKEGRVWGISIISESFKTERGIGIGSSLDLIRLNYPVIRLAQSEKRPPFVRMDGVDGIFIIQAEGEKKVISILIGESPEFE